MVAGGGPTSDSRDLLGCGARQADAEQRTGHSLPRPSAVSHHHRTETLMPKSATDGGRHLKITVVLLHKHVAVLDHLAVNIRLRTGVVLSRASIIDAFIAAYLLKPRAEVEKMLQARVPTSKDRSQQPRGEAKHRKKSGNPRD